VMPGSKHYLHVLAEDHAGDRSTVVPVSTYPQA
jgi:hypothetical protein